MGDIKKLLDVRKSQLQRTPPCGAKPNVPTAYVSIGRNVHQEVSYTNENFMIFKISNNLQSARKDTKASVVTWLWYSFRVYQFSVEAGVQLIATKMLREIQSLRHN